MEKVGNNRPKIISILLVYFCLEGLFVWTLFVHSLLFSKQFFLCRDSRKWNSLDSLINLWSVFFWKLNIEKKEKDRFFVHSLLRRSVRVKKEIFIMQRDFKSKTIESIEIEFNSLLAQTRAEATLRALLKVEELKYIRIKLNNCHWMMEKSMNLEHFVCWTSDSQGKVSEKFQDH